MPLIKVNDKKAYKVEGIIMGGEKFISIRQMYKTKGDTKFKPAKQGVTLNLDVALDVAKAVREFTKDDADFVEIEKD